jgi:hypothetical protein
VTGDTSVPVGYDIMIRSVLQVNSTVIAGAFRFQIEDKEQVLSKIGKRLTEWNTNFRAKYFQMPYGDQCLFLTADTFRAVGGYPQIDFMDDFELVTRLKRRGHIHIIDVAAPTSGRRWKKLGIVRNTIINQVIIVAYLLGVSPSTLLSWYYHKQH